MCDAIVSNSNWIRPEGDGGAGRLRDAVRLERRLRFPVLVGLGVELLVEADLDVEPRRQGVDDGDTDTVETAGHLVALAAELAAGMENGEDDLHRGLAVLRYVVDRDPAAVVHDGDRVVGMDRDVDARAVPGKRFVDRVVDHLIDEVVQPLGTGRADVHAGALPDGLEAFEYLDVLAGVRTLRHERLLTCSGRASIDAVARADHDM
jgi:hypothetical protein